MMPIILSFVISAAVTAMVGLWLVPYLRRVKAGQSIRRDGPVWHMSKEGTPTMGGLMFIAGILAATLLASLFGGLQDAYEHLFMLAFAIAFAAIGFLDDFEKLKKKQNLGLTAIQKFLLQLAFSLAFTLLLRYFGVLTPNLYVPFVGVTVPLPEPLYLAFAAFVMVGTVNSVNLTDGVDGLVTGVSIPVALFFTAVAFCWGYTAVGIFAAALLGGLCIFLCFNFNPAKVFMGDTGSLFLGGAVCALAFGLDMPLVLIPVGLIYIAETLSDIIQVGYFKLSHGKRVFKMAPLHHHLEMCGWSEKKLFAVFTTISAVLCLVTFLAVRGRMSI